MSGDKSCPGGLSPDNAAMIAAAAWPRLQARDFAPPELTADPSLALGVEKPARANPV